MELALLLVVAHFVGDFLCQSDWMALNKSKDWEALAIHVLVYALVLAMFVFPRPGEAAGWLIFNAAAHFVQDAITSRMTSRLWFMPLAATEPIRSFTGAGPFYVCRMKDTRHWFFVVIGADQLLHYATLFVTAGWWL